MDRLERVIVTLRLARRPEGVTVVEVAKETGVSRQSAQNLLHRLRELGELEVETQDRGRLIYGWKSTGRR